MVEQPQPGAVRLTADDLCAALAGFHHEHPGVEIALAEDTSDRLRDRVRAGTLELALVGISAADVAAEPRIRPVLGEPLVAAVAPTHPLADRSRVTLAELAAHPLACLPVGTGIRAVFDQACAAAHLCPQVTLQAAAPRAVADLAARGLGVAILSASMTAEHGDRLRALLIEDVTTLALLALVWAGGPNPALPELLRHCRTAFAAAAQPGDITG